MVLLAFRERVKLPWVATPESAPDRRDVAQKPAAGARDTPQQHHLQSEGEVGNTAVQLIDVMATPAPDKPEGQPQAAAITPLRGQEGKDSVAW